MESNGVITDEVYVYSTSTNDISTSARATTEPTTHATAYVDAESSVDVEAYAFTTAIAADTNALVCSQGGVLTRYTDFPFFRIGELASGSLFAVGEASVERLGDGAVDAHVTYDTVEFGALELRPQKVFVDVESEVDVTVTIKQGELYHYKGRRVIPLARGLRAARATLEIRMHGSDFVYNGSTIYGVGSRRLTR